MSAASNRGLNADRNHYNWCNDACCSVQCVSSSCGVAKEEGKGGLPRESEESRRYSWSLYLVPGPMSADKTRWIEDG